MKLRSDHPGKSQEKGKIVIIIIIIKKNRIKFTGEGGEKKTNPKITRTPWQRGAALPRPGPSPPPSPVGASLAAPGGEVAAAAAAAALYGGPRCGPAHVTAGGVAPVPAGIGRLPARGTGRDGTSPAGSAPGGGDAPARSPLARGRGRRAAAGAGCSPRGCPRTRCLPRPPKNGGVLPPPGEGWLPPLRAWLPCGGSPRHPAGRRCPPPGPPVDAGEDTENFPGGGSGSGGRGPAVLRSEPAPRPSSAITPLLTGRGGVTSLPPSPLTAPLAAALLGRAASERSAPAPHRPVEAPAAPGCPACRGSALPRGGGGAERVLLPAPPRPSGSGLAAGTEALSPLFPVGATPGRGGRRGRSA